MFDYTPAKDLLKDKGILITGAGDGIGRSAAMALAKHGATTILLGKTIPKLEAVYDAIVELGAPEPAIYPLHLEGATPHDYEEMADKLKDAFGHLDGILHNAAILPYLSRLKDHDPEDWFKTLQVNLNAPFLLTQACLPLLAQSESASVVFTSDTVGRKAKAYWGAYGVSKFGLEGLMQTLADELDNTTIRVNSFDPGPTHTKMRKLAFPGEDMSTIKSPEALDTAYVWLFGPDSREANGEAFSFETMSRDLIQHP